jgi:hypothetical protein
VAWLLPENSAPAVAAMLGLYGLHRGDLLRIEPTAAATGGVTGRPLLFGDAAVEVTAGELFGRVLGVEAVPRPFAFEALALHAPEGSEERAKLLEIASPQGADLYHDYCLRERRGW